MNAHLSLQASALFPPRECRKTPGAEPIRIRLLEFRVFFFKGPFSTAGSKASFEAGFSGLGVRVEGLGINEGFGVWSLGLRMSG